MEVIDTKIEGLKLIRPNIYKDDRGYFFESYSQKKIEEIICNSVFVQDNESSSKYGVLRGLHYQKPPFAQAKLVRVIKGIVLDVVVDIRKNSITYGKHFAVELSDENRLQIFIPHGFAHGFVALSKEVICQYKCDNYYSPDHAEGIKWDDEQLNINWKLPYEDIILSDKDKINPSFSQL